MEYIPISAILPCYNHGRFLEERINSILSQTLQVSEIIFLDDASTDNSVEIAEHLLSNLSVDVSFHVNKVNSGSPFAQWNKGVSLAKHSIVWIAETDDSCDPTLLEKLYNSLIFSNSLLAFSQSQYIDAHSKRLGSASSYIPLHERKYLENDNVFHGRNFIKTFLINRNIISNASAVIFHRNYFLEAGLANESMHYCGDWDIWLRMLNYGCISFVSDELNYFRCHQLTTRSNNNNPQYLAESFACRLRALLVIHNIPDDLITLDVFNNYLFTSSRADVTFLIKRLRLHSILKIIYAYSKLPRVPRVSFLLWLQIVYLSIRYSIANRFSSHVRV